MVRDKIRENNNNDLPLAGEILAGGMVSYDWFDWFALYKYDISYLILNLEYF